MTNGSTDQCRNWLARSVKQRERESLKLGINSWEFGKQKIFCFMNWFHFEKLMFFNVLCPFRMWMIIALQNPVFVLISHPVPTIWHQTKLMLLKFKQLRIHHVYLFDHFTTDSHFVFCHMDKNFSLNQIKVFNMFSCSL